MVASWCSHDNECLVRVAVLEFEQPLSLAKGFFLFTQVTKMTKHSLIFVSQPRVFSQPFRLKIVALPVSPTLGFLLLA